jgi:hypothetical protein
MDDEIEGKIDTALRVIASRLTPQARENLRWHVDRTTRAALLDAIKALGPEAVVELAIERLQVIADEDAYHGSVYASPLSPHYRAYRRKP